MICNKVKSLLSQYIDNEADCKDVQLIEAHLSICPSCIAELKEMQKLKEICGNLAEKSVPISLTERVKKGMANTKAKPVHNLVFKPTNIEIPQWLKDWRLYGGAVAAVFAVFLITGPFYSNYMSTKNTSKFESIPTPTISASLPTPSSKVNSAYNQEDIATPQVTTLNTPTPPPSETSTPIETMQPIAELSVNKKEGTNTTQADSSSTVPVQTSTPVPTATTAPIEKAMPKASIALGGGGARAFSSSALPEKTLNVLVISADSNTSKSLNTWLKSNVSAYENRKSTKEGILIPSTKKEFGEIQAYANSNNIVTYKPSNNSEELTSIENELESKDGYYILVK